MRRAVMLASGTATGDRGECPTSLGLPLCGGWMATGLTRAEATGRGWGGPEDGTQHSSFAPALSARARRTLRDRRWACPAPSIPWGVSEEALHPRLTRCLTCSSHARAGGRLRATQCPFSNKISDRRCSRQPLPGKGFTCVLTLSLTNSRHVTEGDPCAETVTGNGTSCS